MFVSCDSVYNDASCVIPPPRPEHDCCMIPRNRTQIIRKKYEIRLLGAIACPADVVGKPQTTKANCERRVCRIQQGAGDKSQPRNLDRKSRRTPIRQTLVATKDLRISRLTPTYGPSQSREIAIRPISREKPPANDDERARAGSRGAW